MIVSVKLSGCSLTAVNEGQQKEQTCLNNMFMNMHQSLLQQTILQCKSKM